jgi:hypothetical protein
MKKLLTIAFTLLLGASLSFAQATGGSTDKGAGDKSTTPPAKTKSAGKKKSSHKGGKKSKKAPESTTPPQK